MPALLPPSMPGMRIGLYGGSFNPAHLGHRHVTLTALRRLGLDRVWWLVTPGNPLKDRGILAPMAERCAAAQVVADHPRITVTGFEAAIGARYTRQTIRHLAARRPGVHFVWIMGADSLASFHRWQGFREIADLVPLAVVDRPGQTLTAPNARAARLLAAARIPESDAPSLPLRRPPAWVYLHGPRSPLSSTGIRAGLASVRGLASTQGVLQSAGEPSNFQPSRPGGKPYASGTVTLSETTHPEAQSPDTALARAGDLRALALGCLDEMKAEETIAIDLAGKTSLADTMIIASGRSQRHVGSIADKIIQEMKAKGFGNARVEGMPACDWVLIDAGDVLVHIFRPEVRGFYNLEKMWGADRPAGQPAAN